MVLPPRAVWHGASLALGAAALFGLSTPLTKLLVSRVDTWVLAGLLYLGAGLGLGSWQLLRIGAGHANADVRAADRKTEWRWLAAAVIAGGIVAPVLLLQGLRGTEATTAALLLNLEGLFSALIAAFVFGEFLGSRIVWGMLAIASGALLLAWDGGTTLAFGGGAIAVAAACLGWALDNNLTRQVATLDAVQVVAIKGSVAGTVNLAIGIALGAGWPGWGTIAAAGAVGLFGYGISLLLFVGALREIGTARTSAYFSAAPFIGAVAAILLLGDPVTLKLAGASVIMAIGVWLHLSERHVHEHVHDAFEHTHWHRHDEHHTHGHSPGDPAGVWHRHRHFHPPLRHAHPHYPDLHHKHRH